jgi:hypothetical protein
MCCGVPGRVGAVQPPGPGTVASGGRQVNPSPAAACTHSPERATVPSPETSQDRAVTGWVAPNTTGSGGVSEGRVLADC